jgi:hypothetical protein
MVPPQGRWGAELLRCRTTFLERSRGASRLLIDKATTTPPTWAKAAAPGTAFPGMKMDLGHLGFAQINASVSKPGQLTCRQVRLAWCGQHELEEINGRLAVLGEPARDADVLGAERGVAHRVAVGLGISCGDHADLLLADVDGG